LSSDLTRKIVIGLDQQLEADAIKALEPFPKLQLDYLRGILSQRDIGLKVSDDLLILHIKLLCQLHPKLVLKEVSEYNYPLDECMKICKEYRVLDALALFTERAGNYMEALEITIGLFKTTLEKKLKKIEIKKEFRKQF